MKTFFSDISPIRFSLYALFIVTIQILVICLIPDGWVNKTITAVLTALFTYLSAFFAHFLQRHKAEYNIKWLASGIKSATQCFLKPEKNEEFESYVSRHMEATHKKIEIMAYLLRHRSEIKKRFFPGQVASFDTYLKDLVGTLGEDEKRKLRSTMRTKNVKLDLVAQFDRSAVYNELLRNSESDKKLISQLRELVKTETISLKFASYFRSKEFDRNTPYLILGKFANIQKGKTVLTDWVAKHTFIPVRASGYANAPKTLSGGNVLLYAFLPKKFYKSAEEVFEEIKQEYQRRRTDVEQVFLVIASIFYDSYYIHIGKNIQYTQSLMKGLRQFLFFKTGNLRFATETNIAQEILNSTDKATFNGLIQRLPLNYYARSIQLTLSEVRMLDSISSAFYQKYTSIKAFVELSDGDRKRSFDRIIKKNKLRYKKGDEKTLGTTAKKLAEQRAQVIENRMTEILRAIITGYEHYANLIKE